MRIISGKFKGRRFYPPADNWPTRPTTDIAKEGLFNILNNMIDFESCKMLDLFGGTGNHCFEFISRGCMDTTYVDKFIGAVKFVQKLSVDLDVQSCIKIVKADVFKFIEKATPGYDYIFAGPPYPLKNIPELPDMVLERQLLNSDGLFVLETNPDHDFSNHSRMFQLRKYGTTLFWFFS